MNTISEYKQMLDRGNRGERAVAINLIKNDNSIDYIDKQGLLTYGYVKNNLFEDAFQSIKNIVNYNLYNLNKERIELPRIFKMADGFWVFIETAGDSAEGCSACCGICCGCLVCMGCLSDCGCLGPFVNNDPTLMSIGGFMDKILTSCCGCCFAPIDSYCSKEFGPGH